LGGVDRCHRLVDLRFRTDDPTLGSFFGSDSFGGVASALLTANRYAYALGNPMRYTNPSGHFVNEFWRNPGLYASIFVQMIPGIGDSHPIFGRILDVVAPDGRGVRFGSDGRFIGFLEPPR